MPEPSACLAFLTRARGLRSRDLGIDLASRGPTELFKWFLALRTEYGTLADLLRQSKTRADLVRRLQTFFLRDVERLWLPGRRRAGRRSGRTRRRVHHAR